jgi:hypothetical protein
MQRTTLAALIALIFCTATALRADPLWDKAIQIAEANKGSRPSRIVVTNEMKDDLGDGLDVAVYSVKGETATLVAHRINGKEQTVGDEKVKTSDLYPERQPLFDPANQGKVTATNTGVERVINGRTTIEFKFTFDGNTGSAFLDKTGGFPLEVSYAGNRLPPGVALIKVRNRFRVSGNTWHAEEIVTTMKGDGTGELRKRTLITTLQYD